MSEATAPAPGGTGAPAKSPVLEIEGVYKHFGGIRAVNGATFNVAAGSITALIGPNGAGKTTLFNVVTGFYGPDAGRITYKGKSIYGKPPYAIARRGMVRTFQITKALAAMPVIDNMLLAGPRQPGELGGELQGLRAAQAPARPRPVDPRRIRHADPVPRLVNLEFLNIRYSIFNK